MAAAAMQQCQRFAGIRIDAVVGMETVDRKALPFEYMLNATRLREGFNLQDFMDRTGLPVSSLEEALQKASRGGLVKREGSQVVPTEHGFDFLSDLQTLFLPEQ